jgi:hypothetical protein
MTYNEKHTKFDEIIPFTIILRIFFKISLNINNEYFNNLHIFNVIRRFLIHLEIKYFFQS